MMNTLNRKMLRDLWHLRGQVFATALVVACGIATFVAMRSTYDSLLASRDSYYASYRFGDVFATLKRAPENVADEIGRLPGVSAVDTRIVASVTLDLPDLPEPAQGRVVSAPLEQDPLNRLFMLRGRPMEPSAPDEIIVSGAFANANRLDPGDTVSAVLNGRLRKLRIAGVALSPEYIYEIRPGDIFPDNRRFGILWMQRNAAESLFQMENAFNDVSVALGPEANEGDVIEKLDRILEQYGGLGAHGRTDQYSHRFVANELAELQVFGTFIPAIFLGVTAFLLHLVLSRLVDIEREQIGLLKAFGYSNLDVGFHYLKLSVFSIFAGVVLGIGLGAWLGSGMSKLYAEFFHFPVLEYSVPLPIIGWALLISVGAGAVGAAAAVKNAVSLPPAEAMRPKAPTNFHAGILESSRLQKMLSTESRIVMRNLVRHPIKALLSAFGISLSVALLFIGFYFFDAIQQIIRVQFEQIQREDVDVVFNAPRPGSVVFDLAAIDGVSLVEPYRVVPARLRSGSHSRRVGITGLPGNGELRRVVDKDFNRIVLPSEGIVLSGTIADSLGVGEGDVLTVEVTEGARPVRRVVVASVVRELIGLGTYMDLDELNRLMREGRTVSGAFLQVDAARETMLLSRLKRTPAVSGVAMPSTVLKSFNDTIARTIGTSTTFLIGFACVIAFGVVYNGARIALAERGREFASLRVLGFTRREIGKMLLGEQAALTAAAIPMGYVVGLGTCYLITKVVDAEIVRLPLVLSFRTFFLAGLIVIAAAVISGLIVTWRLRRMDLIAVLKTRE